MISQNPSHNLQASANTPASPEAAATAAPTDYRFTEAQARAVWAYVQAAAEYGRERLARQAAEEADATASGSTVTEAAL